MAQTGLDEIYKELLKVTGESLKPLGFFRRSNAFRLLSDGNCGLIEFQRSISNSSENLKFTVNLGVVCGELLDRGPFGDRGPAGIQNARIIDAHLRERIGFLLPNRYDKWWEITIKTDTVSLAQEIVGLLVDKGVPYIKNRLETRALIELWESGKAPGLTEVQRISLLSELKKAVGTTR